MNEYIPGYCLDIPQVEPLLVETCYHQGSNETESTSQHKATPVGKPKRGQANRRERVRTENVNAGFDRLRKLIPTEPENRKLSKIEILRLSTSYIKHLYNLSRANSCLEADELDSRTTTGRGGKAGDGSNKPRNHVCTFCLMKTKLQNLRRPAK